MSDLAMLRNVGYRAVSQLRAERSPAALTLTAIAVFVIFTIAEPSVFPSGADIQSMAFALPEVGLLALAIMLSMVVGGIDLSIVGIANLAAVVMGEFYAHLDPASVSGGGWGLVVIGALLALATGALCGAINGLLIGLVGITDILTTLALGYVFGGLALAWTGGAVLSKVPTQLGSLGIDTIGGIPLIFVVFVIAAVVVAGLLNRSRFGLRAILIGSNVTAARLSGIRRPRVILTTYVTSGVLSALAGVIFTARTVDVTATYGSSYVLLAVVIAVLGGVNPNGGFGTVAGVVLGAAILQMVQTGFDVLQLNQFLYQAVQGVILIAVLAINIRLRSSRRGIGKRPAPGGGGLTAPLEPMAVDAVAQGSPATW